jgi:hypothetical protein
MKIDLRGYWDLAKMDAAYDAAGFMGDGYPGSPTSRPRSAVFYFLLSLYRVLRCSLSGHDLSSETDAWDEESGGETIFCSRCGGSEQVFHG